MDDHTGADPAGTPPGADNATRTRHEALRELKKRDTWVPLFAVAAVAVAALMAVLLPSRTAHERGPEKVSKVELATPAPDQAAVPAGPVVKAPPLAATPATRDPAQAMGAPPACVNCGVVENVIAIHGRANGKVEAVGFIMNIRMDDGSTRTVEQRGALAAGSRVIVEHETVRAMTPYG